jgi:hypothetical protein
MEENNLEQPEAQSSDLNNDGEVSAWEKYKASQPQTNVEEVAQENNIQATISSSETEVTAIASSDLAKSANEVQGLGSVADGAIGVASVPRSESKPKNEKPAVEKVAVFSTKNITVPGLGKVYRGYNIVTKDAADQWITKSYIRLATPEEVAKEFGK